MSTPRTTAILGNGNEGENKLTGHIATPPITSPSQFISPLTPPNNDDATPPKVEIKTEPIDYLSPDYKSFDEIKPSSEKNFIKAATISDKNFIEWATTQTQEWIRKPNADDDQALLLAVNKGADEYESHTGRSAAVTAYTVLTGIVSAGIIPYQSTRNITPGQVHFSNDRGKILIHTTPGLHTLTSARHTWGKSYMLSENVITEGIVTIVRILPGHIGLAFDQGHPVVLLPGRHAYNSALFDFKAKTVVNVTTTDIIEHNTLSIIRVRTQELGLASENGNPIILLPGLHIQNSASFHYSKKINTHTLALEEKSSADTRPSNVFRHETITIARVDKNQLGKAQDGSESHLLRPGLYINNTRSFRFDGIENANAPHINYNNIHRIQVPSDVFAKVWNNNKAALLPPKHEPYEINSPTFSFVDFVPASNKVIKHGSITRVVVNDGEIGFAWDHGRAVELQQGMHYKDDPQFNFDKCVPANQDVIQFGHITHIIVPAGQARAIWQDGKLEILQAGRRFFDSPTLKIAPDSIALQNIVKPLKEIKVNTKDRTPMHVTGQVTYRITDPEMFVREMGQERFQASLETTTDAIIRQQIAQTDLSMISPATHNKTSVPDEKESKEEHRPIPLLGADINPNLEGSNFRGQLCHAILEKLRENTKNWGIHIDEFAISDISFQDKNVEKDLADATANTRKAEAQYDLQRAKNLTDITTAETEARKLLIKQENAAKIGNIEAEAKATQMKTAAEAQAESNFIAEKKKAEAEVAAAQAKATAAKAIAESQRDADLAKATGMEAIAKAEAINYNNQGYVQLKMAELQVQAAQYLSKQNVPAMVINGSGGENATASGMFFGQGITMFNTAQALKANQQQQQQQLLEDKKDNHLSLK